MNLVKILRNKLTCLVFLMLVLATILFLIASRHVAQVKISPDRRLPISQKQYVVFKKQYLTIVRTQGPRLAIEGLKAESEKNPVALYYCHDLMHEIGREALVQFKDFSKAASFQDETCVSGYIHGVLQEYFATTNDIDKAMKEVCSGHKKEDFLSWECYHGVGHGLMYFSDNNLPESIEKCSSYKTYFERSACTNGAYMENFTADSKLHPTSYRKASDPFYPCASQNEEYKSGCYHNAPIYYLTLNDFDYKRALIWCGSAEADFRYSCYSGVGAQAMRQNMQKVKYVESICMSGNLEQKNWCIVGMVSYYSGHFGSINPAKDLCHKLEKRNQALCNDAVSLYAKNFK